MEIIGDGFLARNLRALRHDHPETVAFAAGVSMARSTSNSEFAREADLLYKVIRRCLGQRKRILYFSTCANGFYCAPAWKGREEGPTYPSSPYGRHKLTMESVLRHSGVDHLILRLTYTVGPGQRQHQLIPSLISQIRAGVVNVHRGARRDLIHVEDVLAIIDRLLPVVPRKQTMNIATGVPVAIDDIIEHLERALKVTARKNYVADAADWQPVTLDKLNGLLPGFTERHFGADYYRTAIDRYLAGTRPALPG